MNVTWITFHLEEAKEQIEETLRRLQAADYGEGCFKADVEHMLHHIHTAYNSRNVKNPEQITEEEFRIHRRSPTDMEWE